MSTQVHPLAWKATIIVLLFLPRPPSLHIMATHLFLKTPLTAGIVGCPFRQAPYLGSDDTLIPD
jgi:hypothetical protein